VAPMTRSAGSSMRIQPARGETDGPQPWRKCLPYGAVKKKSVTNTHGADAKMTAMAMEYSIDVLCTVSDYAWGDNTEGSGDVAGRRTPRNTQRSGCGAPMEHTLLA